MRFQIPGTIPRAALITGDAQRPAAAIARALTDHGFRVAVQRGSPDLPAEAIVLAADLTDETGIARLMERTAEAIGPVGVLVNTAGAPPARESLSREAWDKQIDADLRVPLLLLRRFAAALRPPHEGVAINLLDRGAWSLMPGSLTYSLAKAGLWRLTQTTALALAPRVRVNAIGSGPVLGRPAEIDPAAIGRAALAILALPSMTGQMIVPDGVPGGAPPLNPEG